MGHREFVRRTFSEIGRVSFAALAFSLAGAGVAHAIPEITSASGCDPDGSGAGTVNCPTRTGTLPNTLTINGNTFRNSGAHVFVGGIECAVTSNTDTEIQCTLPDGSGANVDVVVVDELGVPSLPARLVSYAPPSILTIQGCAFNASDGRSTSGCARAGNSLLTIIGANFLGTSKVIVGGEECDNALLDPVEDQLTCQLRAGKGVDKPVLVLAANQLSAGTGYKVSYAQCPPGTSDEGGLTCNDCDANEFSSSFDSSSCQPCPTGTFSIAGDASCAGPEGYQCWQAKDLKTPRFQGLVDDNVSDSLSSDASVDIKKPVMQCRAAIRGATGETPPSAGFTCYQIKGDKLDPPVPVSITDLNGTDIDLSLSSRKMYCGSTDRF